MNKKFGFSLLAATAMLLAACGGGDTPKASDSKKPGASSTPEDSSEAPLVMRKVTVKGADGSVISEKEVAVSSAIEEPAAPTAPAGKKFYGWKNTKNGGQIWDFTEEHKLNCVMEDVELEPCFVPESMSAQTFEAELVPDIVEADEGRGMNGATYSGGAKGKQLIGRDYDDLYGCTCVSKYEYYEVYATEAAKVDEDIESCADLYEDVTGKITTKKTVDIQYGAYVHFLYEKGDTLTWELESDVAAENVTLFARFSAEYGKPDLVTYDNIDSFNDEQFKIKVNGEQMKYGDVAIHNIEGTSGATFIYCQDYFISASVSLKAGKNTIQMIVDNSDTLNGTIAASAPVIDSIKLYSTSNITWPTAKYTNLIKA